MLSQRSSWDLRINRLTASLEERRRRGEQVIDLTLSNPTRVRLAYPREIWDILARVDSSTYRPQPLGLPKARQAVREYYAAQGIEVDLEQVLLTASTSEAYGFLFKLLADPGDEMLVPRPSYPLFEFLAGLEGVKTSPYPLREGEDGWEVDVDRLAASLSARSRAVVLVSPNNPTGSFVKRWEWEALEALARECDLALIVDEVFGDYELAKGGGHAGSFAGETGVLTFALNGLSKGLGLPQLKLSWIVAGGPVSQRREALARLEVIADTYLSVGTAVQEALPELLEIRTKIQGLIRSRVRENLEFLEARTAGSPGARMLPCEGGWHAVLEVGGDEEEQVLTLLRDEGVLVHPGYFFDFAREGFLVLSLLPAEFEEGVARLLRSMGG